MEVTLAVKLKVHLAVSLLEEAPLHQVRIKLTFAFETTVPVVVRAVSSATSFCGFLGALTAHRVIVRADIYVTLTTCVGIFVNHSKKSGIQ